MGFYHFSFIHLIIQKMAKKKYYVVWVGETPGIYESWGECQLQIKGYPNAKYKSFKTKAEAEEASQGSSQHHVGVGAKKPKAPAQMTDEVRAAINWDSMAVDAACSGNPGRMEYRGVDTKTQMEYFRLGPFNRSTNNIGEFLALVHAIALLKKKGLEDMPIYSDSRTAMAWVRNRKVKTTLTRTAANRDSFELLDRAEQWIKENHYKNPILKWNTKEWGEIPADFGRK